MLFRRSANDPLLQTFLTARNVAESERELAMLLAQHIEPRIKSVIMARLHTYFNNYERHPDFEDLFSEVKTKLVAYLQELKAAPTSRPCKDFRSYSAAITHNVCNDYLRQMYPARTRLYKQVRDLLNAHPDFAIWRVKDEGSRGGWIGGFVSWQEKKVTDRATSWLQQFYESPRSLIEALAPGTDIQVLELDDLVAAIFNHVGESVYIDDLVSVIADIKGVKDLPAISFESEQENIAQTLSDSRLRIDRVLEMREPLKLFWEGLCQLPNEEFRVYMLYAHDTNGEDLITLFLAAKVVTEPQIAQLLGMSIEQFQELWLRKLPLDNESIAKELGITVERVYKLRFQAGKRLKKFLACAQEKI